MQIELKIEYIDSLLSIVKSNMVSFLKQKDDDNNNENKNLSYADGILFQINGLNENLYTISKGRGKSSPFLMESEKYCLLVNKYLDALSSMFEFIIYREGGISLGTVEQACFFSRKINSLSKEEQLNINESEKSFHLKVINEKSTLFIADLIVINSLIEHEKQESNKYFYFEESKNKIDFEFNKIKKRVSDEISDLKKMSNDDRDSLAKKELEVKKSIDKLDSLLNQYEGKYSAYLDAIKYDISEYREKVENVCSAVDDTALYATEKLKVVDGLLQKTSQRGMASAFQQRCRALILPLLIWVFVFFICLTGLTYVGMEFVSHVFSAEKLTAQNIAKIAVTLPLIWGAWFSAKQYNHISQLREDYAYKVAIAMTYHGYKDEAESVHGDMSGKLLDSIVMQFSENPVRLYRTENDASILEAVVKNNKLADLISAIKGGK
ncbi:hypothetical protein [Aeromonas sp. 30P]|uniref:hypothetical protein n=1 Tax=Aeromonas sp. 30P TaxID=3452717 RepID=UPI003F3C5F5D